MAKGKTHHVVPSPEGGGNVKKGGAQRASRHFNRKDEAVVYGRELSQGQKTELVIHGRDGRIQRTDSHGHDPNPPKDKG